MDRRAWWATVHRVANRHTERLSTRISIVVKFLDKSYRPQRIPLSMGFSRQEYWSGCHFLLQGSSRPRDWTWVSCTAGRFFTIWITREAHWKGNPHSKAVYLKILQMMLIFWRFEIPKLCYITYHPVKCNHFPHSWTSGIKKVYLHWFPL